jgi:hypothetical protein
MLVLLISILIRIGIISNEAQYHQLTPEQQEQYKKEIIIDDVLDGI